MLKRLIIERIEEAQALATMEDNFGKRYTLELRIRNLDHEADVVTGWIVKTNEDFPRLITCYVKS